MRTSIVSPVDQKVTWVELFFDLVFVFCVTQIVSLLHDGITGAAVGRVILLFWLVWWAWTQFTWALNAADTTHHWVQLGTLLATAVAFFMAVALPIAFGRGAPWFAVAYVVVRVIGLALYTWVASFDPAQRAAVVRFATAATAGLVAVLLGGFTDGALQYWLWGAAVVLDVLSAVIGANSDAWNLHPEHFAERHGLFVIIALGETLIVAASRVTAMTWSADLIAAAVCGVAVTASLWWIYFARAKPLLDGALESHHGEHRSAMGRDVFSLLHFPIVLGVIGYAAVLEAALSHPHDPLVMTKRVTLAVSLVLFAGGMAIATRRARVAGFGTRVPVVVAAAVLILVLANVPPFVSLLIACLGIATVAVIEQVRLSSESVTGH